MHVRPASPAALVEVPIPEPLAARLAHLTGVARQPASLGELADDWRGDLRDNWRELLLTDNPTVHEVRFNDAATLRVNCALDALMLPFLARRTATIVSADPVTGEEISMTVNPSGDQDVSHAAAILSLGVSGSGDDVHECACPHINLFTSRQTFDTWRSDNASVTSMSMDLPVAVGLARALAGDGEPIEVS